MCLHRSGDGLLSHPELCKMLGAISPLPKNMRVVREMVDSIFQDADADQSGTLSFDEFVHSALGGKVSAHM